MDMDCKGQMNFPQVFYIFVQFMFLNAFILTKGLGDFHGCIHLFWCASLLFRHCKELALVCSPFHALQCWKLLDTADSIPEESFVHAKLVHAHGQDIF